MTLVSPRFLALAALVSALVLGATLVTTAGETSALGSAGMPVATQDDASIKTEMRMVMKTVRGLGKSLGEADAEASMAGVWTLESAFLAAKNLEPEKAAELSGAEKAAFMKAYRKYQIGALRHLLACEEAILDGKFDQAKDELGAVTKMKGPGHDQFKK